MSTAPITGRGLVVRRGARTVLDGVDITITPGAVTGVLGPSGAGKTTLLRVLAGLIAPDSGTVDHGAGTHHPAPGSVALLAQHPRTVCNPRWTLAQIVAEPLNIARSRRPNDSLDEAIRRVNLDAGLLSRYPAQVSDGQLQRACLARILLQAPRFVLADEPIAMLDPVSARTVLTALDKLTAAGTGVALVSHNSRIVRRRAQSVVELGIARTPGNPLT